MFSLYERIAKSSVGAHLQESISDESVFLSQAQRQLIVEELHDVYLAYMYDKSIKTAIIRELVANVFNKPQQNDSVLDGQIIADYITEMGRSHESSNEQCIFGRVALPRHN